MKGMMVGQIKEMKVKTIKHLCGMLAVLVCCACSSNSDEGVNAPQFWTVTLTASMGDVTTRALELGEGNAINAVFEVNDEVFVVDADGSTIVGTLKAQSTGASTTLTGTLDATSLAVNEIGTLRYHSATANYDGQVGTLAGIATSQDYAEGTLTVSTLSPLTFTTTSVTLNAKQSITKFSFTDGTNAVSVKTFGIAATGLVQSIATSGSETVGAVTGTLATASTDVYVALRNNSGAKHTYSFIIQDDAGNWYKGPKKANLANGKSYTATVTLTKLPALTNGSAVGTIGVVGGLPAIVISGNNAVALMNAGALCPEHYGTYYTFANQTSGLSNGWYVPCQTEVEALVSLTKAWGAQNGVNGCTFTIGSNTLFLPAAGYKINGSTSSNVTTFGCYWSSTEPVDPELANLAFGLQFSSSVNNTYSAYKVDGLSVRPFHTLP